MGLLAQFFMNIDASKIKSIHWSDLLLQISTYFDCYDYARTISYKEFWDNCPIGDWLLYFAAKEGSTHHKLIIKAACQCARQALSYVKQGELRPLQAIETTERWLEDKATIEEVRLAAYATYSAAADTADAAADAAAYATYSAASAANAADAAAAYAANAAYYVTVAAYSAAYSVAVAAAYTANSKKEMQLKTADIVRSIIPMPTQAVSEFEKLLKLKAFW